VKTYAEAKRKLLHNPASSYWLRTALLSLETRDVVDADRLHDLAQLRLEEVLNEGRKADHEGRKADHEGREG
jgi:hypothetical protein